MGSYVMKRKHGHVEVFLDGDFCFSADTIAEAYEEIRKYGVDKDKQGVYNVPCESNFISQV